MGRIWLVSAGLIVALGVGLVTSLDGAENKAKYTLKEVMV